MSTTLYGTVETQLETLITALGIPGECPRALFHALAGEALQGPFSDGPQRFSAINADGVPFQWSVSVGSKPGGLRFLTDCGLPGTSISTRIQHSRARLSQLSTVLLFGHALPALDRALTCLLPETDLLDASLMGLWIASGVTPNGKVNLKVYVNERVDDVLARYHRFANCLAAFERWTALDRLEDLVKVVGMRVVPVASAFEVQSTEIGRLKLYFRGIDGTPALLAAAAEAVGCADATARLAPLHQVFLEEIAYPPDAVISSVEFPVDNGEVSFKVDLNTGMFLSSDAEVDRRIKKLLLLMGFAGEEYHVVRNVVVGTPSSKMVSHILFAGLALRQREQRLNVYFHPCPQ